MTQRKRLRILSGAMPKPLLTETVHAMLIIKNQNVYQSAAQPQQVTGQAAHQPSEQEAHTREAAHHMEVVHRMAGVRHMWAAVLL